VEKPDTPAASSRRHREHSIRIELTHPRIPRRWIEAEPSPTIESAAGMATETSALSIEEFNSLTQAKRLAFISYEYQGLTDGTCAGFFTGKLPSGKYPFEVNPMEVANSDNTPQEIIDQHFFSEQAALCQRLDATGKDQTIDSVAASRLLSGVHYYVAASLDLSRLGC
jgi:hypothetical protein